MNLKCYRDLTQSGIRPMKMFPGTEVGVASHLQEVCGRSLRSVLLNTTNLNAAEWWRMNGNKQHLILNQTCRLLVLQLTTYFLLLSTFIWFKSTKLYLDRKRIEGIENITLKSSKGKNSPLICQISIHRLWNKFLYFRGIQS